jgi:hypothetical protein
LTKGSSAAPGVDTMPHLIAFRDAIENQVAHDCRRILTARVK